MAAATMPDRFWLPPSESHVAMPQHPTSARGVPLFQRPSARRATGILLIAVMILSSALISIVPRQGPVEALPEDPCTLPGAPEECSPFPPFPAIPTAPATPPLPPAPPAPEQEHGSSAGITIAGGGGGFPGPVIGGGGGSGDNGGDDDGGDDGCAPGQVIAAGVCVDACPDGQVVSAGVCVDSCPGEQVVSAGVCVDACPEGQVVSAAVCVDACPEEQVLSAGTCVDACPEGQVISAGVCVDACPEGQFVFESTCVSECPAGTFAAGDQCVTECPEGTFVSGDRCVAQCPDGEEPVGDICRPIGPPGPRALEGWMTGGGTITGDIDVHHGFVLNCNATLGPDRLEANWRGHAFHLETLTSASCSDASGIDPEHPEAGFDTLRGSGAGSLDGAPATAEWTFTDAGEPGLGDTASLVVRDAGGAVVLDVSGELLGGNHQAHFG